MISHEQLMQLRREYKRAVLDEHTLTDDPLEQLERWLAEAIAAQLPEPNAMVLTTVSAGGMPSARVVLLKGIENGALHFYTNIESRKGHDIAANNRVALLFYWAELERQVRIEGTAELLDRNTVATYFATRPRLARLAAWASRQSTPLASRSELEQALRQYEQQFAGEEHIPVPPWWGGYRVLPLAAEFWQGRENRLHDRFRYERATTGWQRQRLSP